MQPTSEVSEAPSDSDVIREKVSASDAIDSIQSKSALFKGSKEDIMKQMGDVKEISEKFSNNTITMFLETVFNEVCNDAIYLSLLLDIH